MIEQTRANEPLSQIATAKITFQQLYSESKIFVQLERESLAAASVEKSNLLLHTNAVTSINFTDQGRYSQENKNLKKSFAGNNRCFNCGPKFHLVKQCPHTVNFSCAAGSHAQKLWNPQFQNVLHLASANNRRKLDRMIEKSTIIIIETRTTKLSSSKCW